LRVAAGADRPLLAAWLAAFAAETAQRIGSPPDLAADLIGYGGAVFWEAPDRQPAALATLTRPVARSVRIGIVYSPPERRRGGYASALTHAVSRAVLAGPGPADQGRALLAGASGPGRVDEVVIITDSSRPDRWGGRLGYELVGERTVLRFGPATGAVPRLPTGRSPRLPTGPLPRPPRPGR
ncbi:MAG TPA: hypothetical protein VHF26_00280, partial [Trebonia sp.]|nr:hypothetical protein [Trebonia sp.]